MTKEDRKNPKCDLNEVPDPESRQEDSVVRLAFPEANIYLSQAQIEFDHPNMISKVLQRDAHKAKGRSVIMKINVQSRSHVAFLAFLYDYLSGEKTLPLSLRQVANLQPLCRKDHGPLDVLYAEAIFWDFKTLQMQIHREVNDVPTDSIIDYNYIQQLEEKHILREAPPCGLPDSDSGDSPLYAEEGLDVRGLLATKLIELSPHHRMSIMRILFSRDRVRIWLGNIERGPLLLKPTNSTFFKTQGWMSGRMFVTGQIGRGDLAFEIEVDEPDYIEGRSWKLDVAMAIRSSTPELHRITELARVGGVFHSCMQAIPGRRGLHLYYKAEWVFVTVPPMRVLRDVMVIGWWEKSRPSLTSHRTDRMQRHTSHSTWSLDLSAPIEKHSFDELGLSEAKGQSFPQCQGFSANT